MRIIELIKEWLCEKHVYVRTVTSFQSATGEPIYEVLHYRCVYCHKNIDLPLFKGK